jgi:hypothetical protein
MGLDNIPHAYPCKKQGTAVMTPRMGKDGNQLTNDDGSPMFSIDCEATYNAGGCPYRNDFDKSGLSGGAVYGMLGTDCWYRGKYGNYLVERLGIYDETEGLSFYGALGDNSHKSPHECNLLADAIEDALNDSGDDLDEDGNSLTKEYAYAIWYLRWSALNTEGLDCWY